MKHNLLFKTAVAGAVLAALGACSEVDTGYDPEINASNPVVITEGESFTHALTEDTGVQEINLVDGAMIGGANAAEFDGTIKVTQMEFTVDQNFVTPESESNSVLVANAKISPFSLAEDGRTLLVDTDKFSSGLRLCDSTDLRGGDKTADGAPTPDGNLDFPTQVTYTISYEINNGFDYGPGAEIPRRTLQLTIGAVSDAVESVSVSDVSVQVGTSAFATAQTQPYYACGNSIAYSIDDTSVATVDAATGEITGVGQGSAMLTATNTETGLTATSTVDVAGSFSIAITTQDTDDLGAPTGSLKVPTCSAASVRVEPSLVGADLTGAYEYTWTDHSADLPFVKAVAETFNGIGIYETGTADSAAGNTATVSVELTDGFTNGNAYGDIDAKSVDIEVVQNVMCKVRDGEVAGDGNGDYNAFDSQFESALNLGASPGYWARGGLALDIATGEGMTGNAMRMTVNPDFVASVSTGVNTEGDARDGLSWGDWRGNLYRNRFRAEYGRNAGAADSSYGKALKPGMWIKVVSSSAEQINILHTWTRRMNDVAGGPRGDYRGNAPVRFDATIDVNLGEWQFVEFTDRVTGLDYFQISDDGSNWNPDNVNNLDFYPEWFFSGIGPNDVILIDNLSIIDPTK